VKGIAAILLGVLAGASLLAQTRATVWDGVFTAAQAARGGAVFAEACAECHGADPKGPSRLPLTGERFLDHWMEDSLDSLLNRIKSMPKRGDLDDSSYADVLGFLLDANGFPAGNRELKAAATPSIRMQGKNGPAPVPNFALVDVVACFARGPRDAWMLTRGSEPVRTRNPLRPTRGETEAARRKPLGNQTFQLLDVEYFSAGFEPKAHAGQRVNAKGFLIRAEGEVRINVTWIESLAADCGD
jgi:mono/diheme cytochrome c family protein